MSLYSKGDYERELKEEEKPHRSAFRRDNGRVVHSGAFRRLQGKTQLFPSNESDFFRNRLTHSLEVAQIAKGIAHRLNYYEPFFTENPIDIDLLETAAFCHDLGHPPFGHNGEKALNYCMKDYGGFEGNAQTLRILSRLEKKKTYAPKYCPITEDGHDNRYGLNLTYRTLASVLKYDNPISPKLPDEKVIKGYYFTESELVERIKRNTLGDGNSGKLKSIECQIMDVADDIAYSTYDLEDAFKGEFLHPLDILNSPEKLLDVIAEKVGKDCDDSKFSSKDVLRVLSDLYDLYNDNFIEISHKAGIKSLDDMLRTVTIHIYDFSKRMAESGYYRTEHTSLRVKGFMDGIRVDLDQNNPICSKVYLEDEIKLQVEVLKNFTYQSVIMSPRLKIAEFRGYDIVKDIFENIQKSVEKENGPSLLPMDFRELYNGFYDKEQKMRVICDFVSGMTDRYAVEFFGRLKSENPQSIFKPV